MTTFTQLRDDLKEWSTRDDLTTAQLNTIIDIAEDRIAADVRTQSQRVRTTPQNVTTDNLGATALDLADGDRAFLEPIGLVSVDTDDAVVNTYDLVPSSVFDELASQGSCQHVFCVDGYDYANEDQIPLQVWPSGELRLQLRYYEELPRRQFVSGGSDTNWLLTRHYSVYFKCAMAELCDFIMDDDGFARWISKYDAAVAKLAKSEKRKGRGSGPLVRRNTARVS